MAINLGAMIQAARTQKNPAGDFIANYQNQMDRQKANQQMDFNNLSQIIGYLNGGGKIDGLNLDTNAMANAMGLGKFIIGG